MKTFKIAWFTGRTEEISALDIDSALESIYGPRSASGYTINPDDGSNGVWWASGEVRNSNGDYVATITEAGNNVVRQSETGVWHPVAPEYRACLTTIPEVHARGEFPMSCRRCDVLVNGEEEEEDMSFSEDGEDD